MGGKRRLRAGAPRLLGRHDTADGRAYRRAWIALVAEYGQPPRGSLFALEMGRTAVAWSQLEAATLSLADVRQRRERGHGRRPSSRDVERAARRQGLADGSYASALDKLRELAASRKPRTLAEDLAAVAAASVGVRTERQATLPLNGAPADAHGLPRSPQEPTA